MCQSFYYFPIFSLLLLIVCTVRNSHTTSTGFYVDNGRDKTVIEHRLNTHEIELMKHNLLQFFGIKNPPRKKRSELRGSNSRFLIDIYQKMITKQNSRVTREVDLFDLNRDEENAIDQSDTIISLANQNDYVTSVRHERGQRMWFNVSDVPTSSNIVGAELRIFKNATNANTTYLVSLFKLINIENGERDLEFITSMNVESGFGGWLEINVTDSLTKWVAFLESNKGLYLTASQLGKPGHEVRPQEIGFVTANSDDERQPFMVVFVKTKITFKINHRIKRGVENEKSFYDPKEAFKSLIKNEQFEPTKSCQLRSFYIDFRDLNWQDWIIAPDGYNSYYCHGECSFPLNAFMNATNHAIIQTLVHLVHPEKYPQPCCVPTRYLPISVLYFLDDMHISNVALKRYKKMVAKSCGCH